MQHTHSCPVSFSLIYFRNDNSNLDPCPSSIRNGFFPSACYVVYTPISSSVCSISIRVAPFIPPFGIHLTKHGTYLPLNIQVGPPGYSLPSPKLFLKKLTLFSTPLISAKISIPVSSNVVGFSPAKMTIHITASPESAVRPIRVQCLSFVFAIYFGYVPFAYTHFSPPIPPSPF